MSGIIPNTPIEADREREAERARADLRRRARHQTIRFTGRFRGGPGSDC